MKRSRFSRRGGLTRDAEQLVRLARSFADSGSRVEDVFWESRLEAAVGRLVEAGNEDALNAALDQLYRDHARAYDSLADLVEAGVETVKLPGDTAMRGLLFVAPVLAWSRFRIPAGAVSAGALASVRVQLQAHVLADNARLALADFLFSPDQLPRSYVDTYQLARSLAAAAAEGKDVHCDASQMEETQQFLSDTRYLVGVIAAAPGEAMFRWQESDGSREQSLERWRNQGGNCLQALFTACALEVLLPDAYHSACRNADRLSRAYSLRASADFLQTTLNVPAESLRAVVAPFYDQRLEEYRIGFTLHNKSDVLHGVVWPLLDAEDETSDLPAQIEAALGECGLGEVLLLDHRLPLEYCEECGAPLYPDPDGQPVHAELPEEHTSHPAQLH
ncbi:MAG: DUF2863 family protein [Betaproteobacteria bacterium]|nr:DUF2863 family protein [Betaproteobacteria bacterium]